MMKIEVILFYLFLIAWNLSDASGRECVLRDGTRLEVRRSELEDGLKRYELARISPAGETTIMWNSDTSEDGDYGQGAYSAGFLTLSSIVSKFEDESGVSVLSYPDPGAFVFHFPLSATHVDPILIHYLLSRRDPTGKFEFRDHGKLAFMVENTKTREMEEKGIVRFNEAGVIVEDFLPLAEPVIINLPADRSPPVGTTPINRPVPRIVPEVGSGDALLRGAKFSVFWYGISGVVVVLMVSAWCLYFRKLPNRKK